MPRPRKDPEKPQSNAERQKLYRDRLSAAKNHGTCSICGGVLWGEIGKTIGFHQKCDGATYMKAYREIKKQSRMARTFP